METSVRPSPRRVSELGAWCRRAQGRAGQELLWTGRRWGQGRREGRQEGEEEGRKRGKEGEGRGAFPPLEQGAGLFILERVFRGRDSDEQRVTPRMLLTVRHEVRRRLRHL